MRACQTAELDQRVARVEQLNDNELLRIAMGSRQTDMTSAPQSPKLLALNSVKGTGLTGRKQCPAHHTAVSTEPSNRKPEKQILSAHGSGDFPMMLVSRIAEQ